MKSQMREMRDKCGKSLMRVHRETKIPYQTLQRWEYGEMPKARLEYAVLVAKSLNCNVEDLVKED